MDAPKRARGDKKHCNANDHCPACNAQTVFMTHSNEWVTYSRNIIVSKNESITSGEISILRQNCKKRKMSGAFFKLEKKCYW